MSSQTFPVVWTERHRLHDPGGEVWVGVPIPGTEVIARGDLIRAALAEARFPIVDPAAHDPSHLHRVHDPAMVDYLRTAYDNWVAAGYPEDPGQDRVVPYVFPLPQAVADRPFRLPTAPSARAGVYTTDTTTLVGPGTYAAALSAADCALSAAEMALRGAGAVYAACRPPGHHAGRAFFGGSCYLNNAALAAQALRDGGMDRVALVDLDAHHGNGTQDIFYDRADVLYSSVHVDPGAGWFPHFVGFADEAGRGPGEGANLNCPVAPGCGDGPWLEAVEALAAAVAAHRPEALVVSLGVDGAAGDPESPLGISPDGFRRAAETLAGLYLPTIFVQEGGYDLDRLGGLVVGTLSAFASAGGHR
ncbi:MAG TPA: histone deacetylase family protein [Acidimicrobiia bacterium]|nr:histone deacetylase family protein [Acidimicrobiia bacterium]